MPSRKLAVEVGNLWFKYPETKKWTLKNIDLKIEEGELVAIIGENGAGKTTLIKHLIGLLKPQKGTVKIYGKNTRNHTVAELARMVGIIFQNPDHQLFSETVEKEVEFTLKNFGYTKQQIKNITQKVLKEFNLDKQASKSPLELSQGERKRLTIAFTVAYNPQIIVLDEPTIGQDYKSKQQIAQIIKQLNKKGKTVIIVTHDIKFTLQHIPKTIVMSKGKIIAQGPTWKILTEDKIVKQAKLTKPIIVKIYERIKDKIGGEKQLNYSQIEQQILEAINNAY